MALTTLFYYHSLNYLDASIAIIMLFQLTWLGMLGEWIIDKIRPTRGKIISVIFLFVIILPSLISTYARSKLNW